MENNNIDNDSKPGDDLRLYVGFDEDTGQWTIGDGVPGPAGIALGYSCGLEVVVDLARADDVAAVEIPQEGDGDYGAALDAVEVLYGHDLVSVLHRQDGRGFEYTVKRDPARRIRERLARLTVLSELHAEMDDLEAGSPWWWAECSLLYSQLPSQLVDYSVAERAAAEVLERIGDLKPGAIARGIAGRVTQALEATARFLTDPAERSALLEISRQFERVPRIEIDEDIVNSRFELLVAQLAPDEVGAVPALRAEPSSYIGPSQPVVEEALAASRKALFAERVGSLEKASDSWFDCAETWMALGDRDRAGIALDCAASACEAAGDHEQARAYREDLDTEELSSWAVARMGRPRPVFPPFLGDLL